MKCLRGFKLFIVLVMVGELFAEGTTIHIGEKAELFSRHKRVQDNYQLITGPIIYQEEDDDYFSQGFRLSSKLPVRGEVVREIYDYDKSQSATNIFEQVSKSLIAAGYSILFSCEKGSCGKVEGWQLYLDKLIGENLNEQYYLVAKKKVVADNQADYVAVYINNIDNQPRVLLDIILKPTSHKFDVVIKAKEMARTLEKDGRVIVNGIFFDTGSYDIRADSQKALVQMSQLLKKHSGMKFAVVGHTDNVGDLAFNKQLSKKRAQSVAQKLIKEFGVKRTQLSYDGVGSLSPVTSNSDENGRSLNRRVELIKM